MRNGLVVRRREPGVSKQLIEFAALVFAKGTDGSRHGDPPLIWPLNTLDGGRFGVTYPNNPQVGGNDPNRPRPIRISAPMAILPRSTCCFCHR